MAQNSLYSCLFETRLKAHGYLALLAVFLAFFVLSLFFFPVQGERSEQLRDFDIFWTTAQIGLSPSPADVYSSAVVTSQFDAHFPSAAGKRSLGFLYPPPTLLFLAPFGTLSVDMAYAAFCFMSVALLSLLAFSYAGIYGLLIILGFPALFLSLSFGQLSTLLCVLLGAATWALARAPVSAGFAAGLCILKPQLGFLIGFAALGQRSWRAIGAALGIIALLCLASAGFFPGIWSAALTHVTPNIAEPLAHTHWLQNFATPYALFSLYGAPPTLAFTLQALLTLCAILIALFIFKQTRRSEYRLWAMGLLPLWATPFAYQYDTILHALALLALIRLSRQSGLTLPELLAVSILYVWPLLPMMSATSALTLLVQFFASFCLIACLLKRIHEERTEVET